MNNELPRKNIFAISQGSRLTTIAHRLGSRAAFHVQRLVVVYTQLSAIPGIYFVGSVCPQARNIMANS